MTMLDERTDLDVTLLFDEEKNRHCYLRYRHNQDPPKATHEALMSCGCVVYLCTECVEWLVTIRNTPGGFIRCHHHAPPMKVDATFFPL